MKETKENPKQQSIIQIILIAIVALVAYFSQTGANVNANQPQNVNTGTELSYSQIKDIPDYSNEICVTINDGKPNFTKEEYTTKAFEKYSELDSLGRCGVAYANVCKEIMPEDGKKRGDISSVRPTGWLQAKFNGEYLYNRCHLIAHCLAAEDANKNNLITGTRYFNVQGMLPIENKVANYIDKNPKNHVLYRVTPIFKDNNLLASGVQMEGYSVEDKGQGICFNYYVYNIQPGAKLDYATGKLLQ